MLDEATMRGLAENWVAPPRKEIAFDQLYNGEVRQITTRPSA
jgi:hypothetical protein